MRLIFTYMVWIVMLLACSLSIVYAGTTQGTVIGLRDAGENNWELVIKNDKGKKEAFSINDYEDFKQWNDKTNKGKTVSITWSNEGSGKYAFKVLNKLDVIDTVSAANPSKSEKRVKIIKIEDASEASDLITTDSGEYVLQAYNKSYKKIKSKLKSSVGQKVTLILDADGLIANVK